MTIKFLDHVSLLEREIFFKHLAVMIKSGVSLSEALLIVAQEAKNAYFKIVVTDIKKVTSGGRKLADAMLRHPKVFDNFSVNIIKIGEESGTLEKNLLYLSQHFAKKRELVRKIRSAALYPSIVLSATAVLGFIMAYYVLPKVLRLFRSLDVELPLSTRIIMKTGYIMQDYGLFILFGLILVVVFIRFITLNKAVRPFWHMMLIRMPVIKTIVINYNTASFMRTLGLLLKSGVPIDQSLSIASGTLNNSVYRSRIADLADEIKRGHSIASSMKKVAGRHATLFPLLVPKMIEVGEKSGSLEESLDYLAGFYEQEVSNATSNISQIFEPVLLITIGLIVALFAVSIITPIYRITNKLNVGL